MRASWCEPPPSPFFSFFSPFLCPLTAFFFFSLSFLVVLCLAQFSELRVADCSSFGRSCCSLRQIPSLHFQTHTGRAGTGHTGTTHRNSWGVTRCSTAGINKTLIEDVVTKSKEAVTNKPSVFAFLYDCSEALYWNQQFMLVVGEAVLFVFVLVLW